ncbi:unnamed protein product, partial [Rotaria magnacalcarata]
AVLPSSSSDSQISLTAGTHSSSCISLEPPKQGDCHRDFIWLYFNDIGSTKTSGHRKTKCKYCLARLNFSKFKIMYSHIVHHCNEVVNHDLNARGKTIIKIRDLVKQSLRARSNN